MIVTDLHIALLFSVCLLVTLFAVYFVVPWAARLCCAIALHDVRDQLYDIGRVSPDIRATTVYKDTEFLMNAALFATNRRFADEMAHQMLRVFMSALRGELSEDTPRASIYEREAPTLGTHKDAIAALVGVTTLVGVLYALSQRPRVVVAVTAGLALVLVVGLAAWIVRSNRSPWVMLAKLVQQIPSMLPQSKQAASMAVG